MNKLTLIKSLADYLFTIRYGIAVLLMLIGINYLLSDPTRVIVNSSLFVTTLYSIALFSWLFIKRLFRVHYLLFLLWLIVPYVYLELVQFRFNGGIDASYDVLYWTFTGLVITQGIVWIFSLYPLNMLFQPLVHRQQNRMVKKHMLGKVTKQIAQKTEPRR